MLLKYVAMMDINVFAYGKIVTNGMLTVNVKCEKMFESCDSVFPVCISSWGVMNTQFSKIKRGHLGAVIGHGHEI